MDVLAGNEPTFQTLWIGKSGTRTFDPRHWSRVWVRTFHRPRDPDCHPQGLRNCCKQRVTSRRVKEPRKCSGEIAVEGGLELESYALLLRPQGCDRDRVFVLLAGMTLGWVPSETAVLSSFGKMEETVRTEWSPELTVLPRWKEINEEDASPWLPSFSPILLRLFL